MTTKLETLPAPSNKASAGKPTNPRRPRKNRESRGSLAFSRSARTNALIKHAILIVSGGVMIYPLLWMVVSSLRANELIFRDPGLWLNTLEMGNYTDGWSALTHGFGHYMINSAVVVLGSILGNLISCSMAAYAFARLQFTGQKIFFGIMLLTIMLPFHVVIVPQYILFSQIGWVNTFWPLIVPKLLATDAFFVFLMVQFIRGIPKELDEAARIDGAGHPRIFLRVILPLMVPALATTTIFTFIWTWNDFFGALIYLTDPDMFTVPVALRAFVDSQSATSWGSLFAMSIVSLLPVFLVFLFGQRFLIKGIATTGIK
ncbi:carbohydrate ABC transporter permease [Arthrobacter globiformis]|uniref:Carbohydrate ABC transporter permease n=1 Tax=Arthrobacter globiformis TaxID=1665 RepID=A0A328HQ60_ARTGO|nr:carbohydrate ABC transporter permease [Arthrobacter globiformis]RAM39183.1 carbohydrate ABC transporter permease [Arthrobacter globiformis]